jgi:hypothetical protein
MNERIRELAEQAGVDFFNRIDPEYLGREYCEAWTDQQQKFAELIVRECIDTVLDSSVEYTTRPRIAEELKEHFGVEE